MKRTIRTLLVASAVTAAASLTAAGMDPQSTQSTQSTQSSQSPTQPPQSSQPGAQGRDEAGARQELVQAKEALTELTKLPEASQLQGEARNGVIQIINSFNALVTADTNWYDRYQEVQQHLTRVLGSDVAGSAASESGSVGTSGSTPTEMPAAVRTKLVEFRQRLSAFGKAAGAPDHPAAAGTGSSAGTTGSTTSPQSDPKAPASGETVQQHVDAIADLVQKALNSSPAPAGSTTTGTSGTAGATPAATVTVERATLEKIQSHVQRLRQLAGERGIR